MNTLKANPHGWNGLKAEHETLYDQMTSFSNAVVGKISEYMLPRLGFKYRLYRKTEGDYIVWGGAGEYLKPENCDTWALARDFVAPDETPETLVESREFYRIAPDWFLTCDSLVWNQPYWLKDVEPVTREELLEWIAARSGILARDGYLTFMSQEASLLYWLERDFLILPVFDPSGKKTKTYYVYRSIAEFSDEEEEEDFSI